MTPKPATARKNAFWPDYSHSGTLSTAQVTAGNLDPVQIFGKGKHARFLPPHPDRKIQGHTEKQPRKIVNILQRPQPAHHVSDKIEGVEHHPQPGDAQKEAGKRQAPVNDALKRIRCFDHPFFHIDSPLPLLIVFIRGFRPVNDVVEERPCQDAARGKETQGFQQILPDDDGQRNARMLRKPLIYIHLLRQHVDNECPVDKLVAVDRRIAA